MAHLFSPMTIARKKLNNRIVMAPLPSGYATLDGFVDEALFNHYLQYAQGGVGLIITEPVRVVPPQEEQTRTHIGLYSDAFIPRLRRMVDLVHEQETRICILLDAPSPLAEGNEGELRSLAEHFLLAAWRALAAGFDGVVLSTADGGVFQTLVSPLRNHRYDAYGRTLEGRLHLPLMVIEGMRQWFGGRMMVGFRLIADEFAVGGITLQDARAIAVRAVRAGATLLDVTAETTPDAPVARFPGWCIPLAHGIKRFLPDVPVIGSGFLGEPYLADSVVRDGSVDLVMLEHTLLNNPGWPQLARAFLMPDTIG